MWIAGLGALAYLRLSLHISTIAILLGLIITTLFADMSWIILLTGWFILGGMLIILNHSDIRRKWLIQPLFKKLKKTLPPLSETEKNAIAAGTVGWDAELFSGKPDWAKLHKVACPLLTDEERAFIDGPVKTVCNMINDWEVNHIRYDLSETVWAYLKKEGFFGLIIPKSFGGKGFSAYAHSEILTRLASRSVTLGSTVSVPNSLGPAELILHYGTKHQQDYYLPRLASSEEIPCFALTGPEAGSDASAMPDTGVICKGQFEGRETLGIRLNWNKRYITLAPVATLLGLAFKLYDPEHLISDEDALGITCALIPTHLPGVTIGRRHMPLIPFQNGPTQGHDVFIPLDYIIGGQDRIGQGWQMLVECLSAGRGISLPSISCGGGTIAAITSGAYARIRRQFRTEIANFEGIQEVLGRMGGLAYLTNAARSLTASFIDQGEKPSVLGAIVKYHVTEMGRTLASDAMDIHAGKALIHGPSNYLAYGYAGVPIGITVEGANILTRSMIIFGQGGIRCHPYLLEEMNALANDDIETFEKLLAQHTQHTLSNIASAFFKGISRGCISKSPVKGRCAPYYRQLNYSSAALAVVCDISMALLGGKLKFKESLSARLGDLLSYSYLCSAALKFFRDHNEPEEEFALLAWSCEYCLSEFWSAMSRLLDNFPNRPIAWLLRGIVMPFGKGFIAPNDKRNLAVTKCLTTENPVRNRLLEKCIIAQSNDDGVQIVMQAFKATIETEEIYKKIQRAIKKGEIVAANLFPNTIQLAYKANIINEHEAKQLNEAHLKVTKAIAVDDFAPQDFINKSRHLSSMPPQQHSS